MMRFVGLVALVASLTVTTAVGLASSQGGAAKASQHGAVTRTSVTRERQIARVCHRYGYSAHCLPAGLSSKTAGGLSKALFHHGVPAFVCAFETFVGSHEPGTPFTCTPIPLLMHICPGEVAHSVSIHGTNLNLRVIKPVGERIYIYDPGTGQSHRVYAITGFGGEYTKILGFCTSIPLPITGGAG